MPLAVPGGPGLQDNVFPVILVEQPVPAPEPEPEPEPEPVSLPERQVPLPEQVMPETRSAPPPVEQAEQAPPLPAPVSSANVTTPIEAAPGKSGPDSMETVFPVAIHAPAPAPSAAQSVLVEVPVTPQERPHGGDNKEMRETYLRDVRLQLARHAPRGVRGAGDCAVEFRLSRSGEVVFVGLQTSSGSRIYDRRCLNAVTSTAPFPPAPDGIAATDLSFRIAMQQSRARSK